MYFAGKTMVVISAVVVCSLLWGSCTKMVAPDDCTLLACDPTPVSYNANIKPLITTYCATNLGPGTGCHDAWIFDYNEVKKSIESGAFERVIVSKEMPKIPNDFGIGAMSEAEIKKFRCWICDGYPEN